MSIRWCFPLLLVAFVSIPLISQNCNPYYPLEKGTRWVMHGFNKQNELINKSIQTVKESGSSPAGGYSGKITGEIRDVDNEIIGVVEYHVECQDGKYLISMNSFLNPAQMKAYENMEVKIDGDFLELPPDLPVGLNLPNASVKINVQNAGDEIMALAIRIRERNVEKRESVTTPAGTFECTKIIFGVESQMGEDIPIVIKSYGAEWIAKGVGIVKSEQYDENRNMISFSILEEFAK